MRHTLNSSSVFESQLRQNINEKTYCAVHSSRSIPSQQAHNTCSHTYIYACISADVCLNFLRRCVFKQLWFCSGLGHLEVDQECINWHGCLVFKSKESESDWSLREQRGESILRTIAMLQISKLSSLVALPKTLPIGKTMKWGLIQCQFAAVELHSLCYCFYNCTF